MCDLRDLNRPVVKIGDLGLSKKKASTFVSGNMRGTLPWMAPELFPSMERSKPSEDDPVSCGRAQGRIGRPLASMSGPAGSCTALKGPADGDQH